MFLHWCVGNACNSLREQIVDALSHPGTLRGDNPSSSTGASAAQSTVGRPGSLRSLAFFCRVRTFRGKPPVFSGREEHFCVWTKKVENYVSGVFPSVHGALTFVAESQDVVTATVAIGVPELGVETSAEMDGHLFVVLSALTEGESFDIVMSAGGDHGFESWRKLHGRWNSYTAEHEVS